MQLLRINDIGKQHIRKQQGVTGCIIIKNGNKTISHKHVKCEIRKTCHTLPSPVKTQLPC